MKISEGDIFSLCVIDNKIIIGQILQKNRHDIYIVIFRNLYECINPQIDQVKKLVADQPAIVGRTSDLFFKLNSTV